MSQPRRLLEDPQSLAALLGGEGLHLGDALLRNGSQLEGPSAEQRAQLWGTLEKTIAAGAGAAAVIGAQATATGGAATTAGAGTAGVAVKGAGMALVTKLGLLGIVTGATLVGVSVASVHVRENKTAMSQPSETRPALVSQQSPDREAARSSVDAKAAATDLPTSDLAANDLAASDDLGAAGESPRRESKPLQLPASPLELGGGANEQGTGVGGSLAGKPRSALLDEARQVQLARSQLGAGRAGSALSTLAALDHDIPRGVLGQERTVLKIEALSQSGRTGEARSLAEAFLSAYPKSPHAARVGAYVAP